MERCSALAPRSSSDTRTAKPRHDGTSYDPRWLSAMRMNVFAGLLQSSLVVIDVDAKVSHRGVSRSPVAYSGA
jgi:hypothetical protein